MTAGRSVVLVLAGVTVLLGHARPLAGAPSPQADAGPRVSVWTGVYTDEQAERGRRVYLRECSSCHGPDLRGGETAPGLVGRRVVQGWSEGTLGELFELTQKTMPQETPGGLSDAAYAAVVAYMLQANTFPAGDTELAADVTRLDRVTIETEAPR